MFIVLSGYLMARQHTGRWTGPAVGRFYIRRYFRIAPAYYLSLSVAFGLGGWFLDGYLALAEAAPPGRWPPGGLGQWYDIRYDSANLLAHLTFAFGFSPSGSFSTFLPDWSIGLEMQFYAAFPFLAVALRRWGGIRTAAVLAAAAMAATAVVVRLAPPFREPSLLAFHLHLFLAGMLAAGAVARFPAAAGRGLALLAFALVCCGGRHPVIAAVTGLIAYLDLATVGAVPTTRALDRAAAALGGRAARFLADTSYCVYLFHGFFISMTGLLLFRTPEVLILRGSVRFLLLLGVVLPTSYIVAYAAHWLVERPGITLGRLVARRLVPGASVGRPEQAPGAS